MSNSTSKPEFVTPVDFPEHPDIYKSVEKKGVYYSEFNKRYSALDVQEFDLIDYLNFSIEHLEILTEILKTNPSDKKWIIMEPLLKLFDKKINDLNFFIKKNVGSIKIETINDEIVGAYLEQIEKTD